MAHTNHPDVDALTSATAGLNITPGVITPASAETSPSFPFPEPTPPIGGHQRAKSMAKFAGTGDGERLPPDTHRTLNSAAPELPKEQIPTLEKLSVLRRAEQYPQWKSYLESAAAFGKWTRLLTEIPVPHRLGETSAEFALLSEAWIMVHKGLLPQLQAKIDHALYEEHVAPRWKESRNLTIKGVVESLDTVFIPRGPISQVAAFSELCALQRTKFPSSVAFCDEFVRCLNKAAEFNVSFTDLQASLRLVGECGPWHSGWYEMFRLTNTDARNWPAFHVVRQAIIDAELTVGAHAPDRPSTSSTSAGQANAANRESSSSRGGRGRGRGRGRGNAPAAKTTAGSTPATPPQPMLCTHCKGKTHNEPQCYYTHPDIRPANWVPYHKDIVCVP